MSTATENRPDDAPEPSAAPAATETEADDLMRFRTQTVINFIEVKPRNPLSDRVQYSWDMAAIAMLDGLRRMYGGQKGGDGCPG